MALQAATTSAGHRQSALPGLPIFWEQLDQQPQMEWEKWWDLCCVAVMAKYSIEVPELLRRITPANPRNETLLGGLNPETAERKVVSVLFLAIGAAARKNLMDRFPEMVVSSIALADLLRNCVTTFAKLRNRTLDRFTFLSRKQNVNETLQQFWNSLTGLAAKCAFGEQTDSLILDVFILNMTNKTVQERLCTEPKEPQEALRFAVSFEEGIKRQQRYGLGLIDKQNRNIKEEPVYIVQERKKCFRCGNDFDQEHVRTCLAKSAKCRMCGGVGHFATCL